MSPRDRKLRDWRHNDRPGRAWAAMSTDPNPIFASSEVGSRIATKVRIAAGAFAGQHGIVVRRWAGGDLSIRLDSGATIPFARCELQRQEA